MRDRIARSSSAIRLVFQLERADNPLLYDDLIRFKKGVKRVNRLRTLVQEGLLAQQYRNALGRPATQTRNEVALRDEDDARITNQVFDAPTLE